MKKVIKGKNFNLIRFKPGDEKLYDLVHTIFNDEIVKGFINPEYLKFKSKSKVIKWVDSNANCKCEVWYSIRVKEKYIGYICYKSRKDFPEGCELTIVLAKGYRGFKIGFQITKLLIDYIVKNKLFAYIIAYSNKTNKLAEKLLKQLGFQKTNKLHKLITKKLYNENITLNIILNYNLFTIFIS
ncbi:MAG: GNAT family N-acetyltransferase [Ignavibacteriae bacterium]|nr:GNAT family N-acetyltransferase [Ignavibacteriota bacterium]